MYYVYINKSSKNVSVVRDIENDPNRVMFIKYIRIVSPGTNVFEKGHKIWKAAIKCDFVAQSNSYDEIMGMALLEAM